MFLISSFFLYSVALLNFFFISLFLLNVSSFSVFAKTVVLTSPTLVNLPLGLTASDDLVIVGHYSNFDLVIEKFSINSINITATFEPGANILISDMTITNFLVINSSSDEFNPDVAANCSARQSSEIISSPSSNNNLTAIWIQNVNINNGILHISPFYCVDSTISNQPIQLNITLHRVTIMNTLSDDAIETSQQIENEVLNSTVAIVPRVSYSISNNNFITIARLQVTNNDITCRTSCPTPKVISFPYTQDDFPEYWRSSLGCTLFSIAKQNLQEFPLECYFVSFIKDYATTPSILWSSSSSKNNYKGGVINFTNNNFQEIPSPSCNRISDEKNKVDYPGNRRALINLPFELHNLISFLDVSSAKTPRSFTFTFEKNKISGFMSDSLVGIKLNQNQAEMTDVASRGISVRIQNNNFVANPGGYHEKGGLILDLQLMERHSEFEGKNENREDILTRRIRTEMDLQSKQISSSSTFAGDNGIFLLNNIFSALHNCRKYQNGCLKWTREAGGVPKFSAWMYALHNVRIRVRSGTSLTRFDIGGNQFFAAGSIKNVNVYFNDKIYDVPRLGTFAGVTALDEPANPYKFKPRLEDTVEIGFVNVSNNNFTVDNLFPIVLNGDLRSSYNAEYDNLNPVPSIVPFGHGLCAC
jgi:hypothetical protein